MEDNRDPIELTDVYLKEFVARCNEDQQPHWTEMYIPALLRRLEKAERALQFMYISSNPIDLCDKEAYREWHKLTGRKSAPAKPDTCLNKSDIEFLKRQNEVKNG